MTVGSRFSLQLLVVPLLFAVELPLLRQVVGLPPLGVPFARVRSCHPLSAMAVGNSDMFALCPIALRILEWFLVVPQRRSGKGRLRWPVRF